MMRLFKSIVVFKWSRAEVSGSMSCPFSMVTMCVSMWCFMVSTSPVRRVMWGLMVTSSPVRKRIMSWLKTWVGMSSSNFVILFHCVGFCHGTSEWFLMGLNVASVRSCFFSPMSMWEFMRMDNKRSLWVVDWSVVKISMSIVEIVRPSMLNTMFPMMEISLPFVMMTVSMAKVVVSVMWINEMSSMWSKFVV